MRKERGHQESSFIFYICINEEGNREKPRVILYILLYRLTRKRIELFNDWGGRGYDDSVPGEVTKTAPSGDRTT